MTSTRAFRIPVENLPDLTARFEKLAKRAVKLGVPAPTFTAIAVEETDTAGVLDTWHWVVVEGAAPKFAGWELTAVIALDHAEPDAPNVVTTVGAADLDEILAWRGLGDVCDHCHVDNRGRNKLVVVTHETGERKIVGTTCLRDFLGHTSPTAIATWAQWIEDAADLREYEERGARTEYRFDPVTYLAWTVRAITDNGWVPRSRGGEALPTADVATELLLLDAGIVKPTRHSPKPDPLLDAELATATDALTWAKAVAPTNDYLANLQAVASKTSLRYSDLGLAASAVTAFQRDHSRAIEKAAVATATAGSVHFGAVKERLDVTGTVTMVRIFEGFYGPTALVKLLIGGNVAVWWCSNVAKAPAQGATVTGKATVKAHEEYEGVAQTVLTRAALTVVEAEAPAPALIDPDVQPLVAAAAPAEAPAPTATTPSPAAAPAATGTGVLLTPAEIVAGARAEYPSETLKAPEPVLAITGRHTRSVKAWWAVNTPDGMFVATDAPAAAVPFDVEHKRTVGAIAALPEIAPLVAHAEAHGIPIQYRI